MNHAELFANLAQHGVHPMRGAAAADQSSATSIVEYVRSQLTTYAPGSITNQVIEDAFVGACLLGFTGQGKTSLARSCRYALAESPNETVYPTEMLTAPQGMTASKTLSFGAYRMVNKSTCAAVLCDVRGAENTGDGFLYELTRINRGDVVSSLSYNRGWFNRLWCQVRSVFSSSDIAIGAFIIVHTLSDAMVGTDTLDAFTEIVRTIITDWKKGVIVALTHKMACANARAAKTGVWDAQHYDGLVRAVATANGPAAAAAIAARRAFVESLAYDDYVKCVHAHIARTFHIDHDCVFVFDNLTTAADTPAARPADASAIALLALKAIRMAENQIGQIGQR